MTRITTISLIDQFRASQTMYQAALENMDALTDRELLMIMDCLSCARLAAVVGRLSGARLAAVVGRLSGAQLADVVACLSGSQLAYVVDRLSGAQLADVVACLSDARLADVVDRLSGAWLAYVVARLNASVPIIADLDKRIAEMAEAGSLDMGSWHSTLCGTTHCRAGHAINMAGDAGYALEKLVGPEMAGRLIYEASTGRPAPDFYAGQDDAIADIRRCAALGSAA